MVRGGGSGYVLIRGLGFALRGLGRVCCKEVGGEARGGWGEERGYVY